MYPKLRVEILLSNSDPKLYPKSYARYGFGCFYNDPWKGFDLLVALGTSAGYVADNAKLAQFAKSFRLMRVVRLMKMIKAIRVILETLLQSIPQVYAYFETLSPIL